MGTAIATGIKLSIAAVTAFWEAPFAIKIFCIAVFILAIWVLTKRDKIREQREKSHSLE